MATTFLPGADTVSTLVSSRSCCQLGRIRPAAARLLPRALTVVLLAGLATQTSCSEEESLPRAASARDTLIVDSTTGEQLYRNAAYRFRITFPAGWEVKDGDGPHVTKKAVSRGSSVLVLVRDAVTPEIIAQVRQEMGSAGAGLSDADIAQSLRSELDSRVLEASDYPDPLEGLAKFGEPEVLEREMRHLDNLPAAFARTRVSYSAGDQNVRVESLTYSTFREGRLYQVQAASPAQESVALRPTLERSLRSFVFEEW